jgi:hypothetical protein
MLGNYEARRVPPGRAGSQPHGRPGTARTGGNGSREEGSREEGSRGEAARG